jgi:hypothetical protein
MRLRFLVFVLALTSAFGHLPTQHQFYSSPHSSVSDSSSVSAGILQTIFNYPVFKKHIPAFAKELCRPNLLESAFYYSNDTKLRELETRLHHSPICAAQDSRLWIWEFIADTKVQQLVEIQRQAQSRSSQLAFEQAQRNLETQKLELEKEFQDEYEMERIIHFNQLQIARSNCKQQEKQEYNLFRLPSISSSRFAPMMLSIFAYELAKAAYHWISKTIPEFQRGKSKCKQFWRRLQSRSNNKNVAKERRARSGWLGYDAKTEFSRMGLPGLHFRQTSVNDRYQLTPSYPSLYIVPKNVSDEELRAAARFRSKGRFIAVTWKNPKSPQFIARSSQPQTGIQNRAQSEDTKILDALAAITRLGGRAVLLVCHA